MASVRQICVLGLGRFGQSIVKKLIENRCEVLCVDKNAEIVNEMAEYCQNAIIADISDPIALDKLGLNNFDTVIIATGDNLESTIIAIMCAKEKGVKQVIAKARNDMQAMVFEKLGADRVVMPERDMGARLAMSIVLPNVLDYINLSDKLAIAEIEPKSEWVGKDLISSNIRATTGLNVIAIRRNGEMMVSPSPKEVIRMKDILYVVGSKYQIQSVSKVK